MNLHFKSIDLTQIWSKEVTGTIEYDDLLAMAAVVCFHIKPHFTPQQRYIRSLPELLTALAAPLFRRQPDDVQELHNGHTIQQVVHREFRILQPLGYDVTVLTPMDWIDIYRWRHTLRQRLQCGHLFQEQSATLSDSLSLPCQSACSNPHPGCSIQPHLHSQPHQRGCLHTGQQSR